MSLLTEDNKKTGRTRITCKAHMPTTFFWAKRVIPYYPKVSSYQSKFTRKSTGSLTEHFDFARKSTRKNAKKTVSN